MSCSVLENSCPAAIGSACISCDILDQRTNKKCEKMKICEQKNATNVCYCAPGFIGTQCRKGERYLKKSLNSTIFNFTVVPHDY